MKKMFRVVKIFKIVKRSCSLNRYYRVGRNRVFRPFQIFLCYNSLISTILTVTLFCFFFLRKLNLCSTGVNIKPLTRLLKACHTLEHLNLAGCRSLPRPMKKCYTNREAIVQLRVDILAGKFNNDDDEDDDQAIAKINKQRKTTTNNKYDFRSGIKMSLL